MNTQTSKNLRSGFTSALLAAGISIAMLALITKLAGATITLAHLAYSGLMIGCVTFILAFLIGSIVQLAKTSR